ncbi:hypothetical protein EZV62_023500 [Acer yangbiense]|uniref:RHOMBOID-like protein n=1 Tax=Acer yangbiense TaxID=1000413 RepID=A0A5C7H3Y5_9ROSI|nr:hypothetical protein EZV62_023500 [Acer yangbiense]
MANSDVERGGKNSSSRINHNNNSSAVSPFYVETGDKQWTSWLIPMFVIANVAVFVITMYVNNCPHNNNNTSAFQSAFQSQGVIHLLANMLSLVFIGIRLEQQFGFVRVGTVYLVSGLGGSILSALFIQHNISVGASGALFGLLGAMLSELLTNWTIYANKAAALLTLVVIIAINLAVGILPHVDNFAHIGGFLTGFLLGFVLLLRPQFGWSERQHLPAHARVKSKHKAYQYGLWLAAMVLLIVG